MQLHGCHRHRRHPSFPRTVRVWFHVTRWIVIYKWEAQPEPFQLYKWCFWPCVTWTWNQWKGHADSIYGRLFWTPYMSGEEPRVRGRVRCSFTFLRIFSEHQCCKGNEYEVVVFFFIKCKNCQLKIKCIRWKWFWKITVKLHILTSKMVQNKSYIKYLLCIYCVWWKILCDLDLWRAFASSKIEIFKRR